MLLYDTRTPREKGSYSEFFWFECGKIQTRKTPNTIFAQWKFCIFCIAWNGLISSNFIEICNEKAIRENRFQQHLPNKFIC